MLGSPQYFPKVENYSRISRKHRVCWVLSITNFNEPSVRHQLETVHGSSKMECLEHLKSSSAARLRPLCLRFPDQEAPESSAPRILKSTILPKIYRHSNIE